MTEIPREARWVLDEVFGEIPAEPASLDQLLRFLERLPFGLAEKKYVLILWLSRAGIALEAWMVVRLGGT